MTGPFSANIILSNPTVDVAVLETARGGILRAGLGFDECDVGVVLNVSADHLGLRRHQHARAARRREERDRGGREARGPRGAQRRRSARARDARPVARRRRALLDVEPTARTTRSTDHLARAGIAVLVERDTFVVRRGRLRIPIAGCARSAAHDGRRRSISARQHPRRDRDGLRAGNSLR